MKAIEEIKRLSAEIATEILSTPSRTSRTRQNVLRTLSSQELQLSSSPERGRHRVQRQAGDTRGS